MDAPSWMILEMPGMCDEPDLSQLLATDECPYCTAEMTEPDTDEDRIEVHCTACSHPIDRVRLARGWSATKTDRWS